jgi:hypothetical protein
MTDITKKQPASVKTWEFLVGSGLYDNLTVISRLKKTGALHWVLQRQKDSQYFGRVRFGRRTRCCPVSFGLDPKSCSWKATDTTKSFEYHLDPDLCQEGPWDSRSWNPPPKDILDAIIRFGRADWMTTLLRLIEANELNKDNRSIYVVIDPAGFHGKSHFGNILRFQLGWVQLQAGGANDSQVMGMAIAAAERNPESINGWFCDMPRGTDIASVYTFFRNAEQIRQGMIFDLRGKARQVTMNPRPMIIFTNNKIPRNVLSADRVIAISLSGTPQLVPSSPLLRYSDLSNDSVDHESDLFLDEKTTDTRDQLIRLVRKRKNKAISDKFNDLIDVDGLSIEEAQRMCAEPTK